MPVSRRAIIQFKDMNMPVSYRINETGRFFRDASNVVSNQGRLETRNGTSRFNSTALPSAPLSISYYEKADGARYYLAKCEGSIYSVQTSGAHTELISGLSSTSKHRAVTANNRHIICVEGDGLYSFDGTTFTQLGQAAPGAPNVSVTGSGATLPTATYYVAYTFYSTSTGFETNIGTSSSGLSVTLGQKITFGAAAPATAANATIDKVRVYLKSGAGAWLFIEEGALGFTPADITASASSTQTPPTANATPPADAKYIAWYDRRIVVSGSSSYPNDVFFSEQDIPDAWSDLTTAVPGTLFIPGDGAVTGLGVGFFDDGSLSPFLCVFKKRLSCVYSQLTESSATFTILDSSIGCVGQDTVSLRNGSVYFMSETGWRIISRGTLVKNKGDTITLGGGAIDDIFTSPGFIYELNKGDADNFHSVYMSDARRYITFVSEGVDTTKRKAYAFEFDNAGFKPFLFPFSAECSCMAEDSAGREILLLGTTNGYIIKHSSREDRTDIDISNTPTKIDAFAQLTWISGEDYDASYNFRVMTIKAVASENDVIARAWVGYSFADATEYTYSFDSPGGGFILDVSRLDVDIMSDDRSSAIYQADINRRGQVLCVGFYQSILNANINLISVQIDFSKNGNRN